jgi:hypothetical protein
VRGAVIIAGSVAQRPGVGGHAWVFLQYLLGFKRLGYEVLFLDWLDATMCFDKGGERCAVEDSRNLRYLSDVMAQVGLTNAWSVNYNNGARTLGLPRAAVLEFARRADVLIKVMGFLADAEILALPRRRVFLDIDPGFGQMWQDLGLATVFSGHDVYLTIGENIGQPDCTIPTCGLEWITSPQPVVLEEWPAQAADGARLPASRVGAGRSGRSSIAGRLMGCASMSSANSPRCLAGRGNASRWPWRSIPRR